ncbi:hypothetical protein CRG98_020382 [Punica granatum]|uniref:Uncharacterized protein n=1 Tax=Punica granatum TaxID=22663 RepID=A0A2I0JSC0_PUNGR|nr:hypothetical protein CRG98_020382 [Punica granatum]
MESLFVPQLRFPAGGVRTLASITGLGWVGLDVWGIYWGVTIIRRGRDYGKLKDGTEPKEGKPIPSTGSDRKTASGMDRIKYGWGFLREPKSCKGRWFSIKRGWMLASWLCEGYWPYSAHGDSGALWCIIGV